MQVKTYNGEGKEEGTMELPSSVFGVELNPDLVHQVVVAQIGNKRQISGNTKGRGDVSGGGRKPWAQKHTGNARHGSIRSPIWKGGGVSHGPTVNRNFKKKINTKMRRKALFMVLSEKARRDQLVVLHDLKLAGSKTKTLNILLKSLPCDQQKSLIALPQMDNALIRAGNNLSYCSTIQARDLNVIDLLNFKYLVMPKESIKVIEETFAKSV